MNVPRYYWTHRGRYIRSEWRLDGKGCHPGYYVIYENFILSFHIDGWRGFDRGSCSGWPLNPWITP